MPALGRGGSVLLPRVDASSIKSKAAAVDK
jgi:hypothetical protein